MLRIIRRKLIFPCIFSMLVVCWGAVGLHAGLPDFVRDDVGLCLHVREISSWVDTIENSEIRTRLEATAFFQRWKASRDFAGLQAMIQGLEQSLERPLPETLRFTFGQEILLAVYPGVDERPAGVLMTRTTDQNQTQKLIELWNRMEGASVDTVDDKYMRRTSSKGPQLYYFLGADLFALSDREELIAELAALGETGFGNSLTQSARWKRAIGSLGDSNWAVAYFQPDRWKHLLAGANRDSFETAFFRQIGLSECLIAGADGHDGLHARANLLYPVGGEPQALQQFRERTGEGPTNWSGLTAQTLLMAVGRSDPGYLADVIKRQSPKTRELLAGYEILRGLLLGRDPLDEVLPYVGRRWQYSIVSQPDRILFPWDIRLQLDLEESSNGGSAKEGEASAVRPDLHTCLQNLVRTLARIGGLFLSEPLAARSQLFSDTLPNGATIDGFETVLGLSPTIGIGSSKLVVSNSRQLVERDLLNSAEQPEPSEMSERLTNLAKKCCLGVYLNVGALRSSLALHAEVLFRLQKLDEGQIPAARRRIEQQLQVLSLVDSAYLFGILSEDLVSIHFGVESLPGGGRKASSND